MQSTKNDPPPSYPGLPLEHAPQRFRTRSWAVLFMFSVAIMLGFVAFGLTMKGRSIASSLYLPFATRPAGLTNSRSLIPLNTVDVNVYSKLYSRSARTGSAPEVDSDCDDDFSQFMIPPASYTLPESIKVDAMTTIHVGLDLSGAVFVLLLCCYGVSHKFHSYHILILLSLYLMATSLSQFVTSMYSFINIHSRILTLLKSAWTDAFENSPSTIVDIEIALSCVGFETIFDLPVVSELVYRSAQLRPCLSFLQETVGQRLYSLEGVSVMLRATQFGLEFLIASFVFYSTHSQSSLAYDEGNEDLEPLLPPYPGNC